MENCKPGVDCLTRRGRREHGAVGMPSDAGQGSLVALGSVDDAQHRLLVHIPDSEWGKKIADKEECLRV